MAYVNGNRIVTDSSLAAYWDAGNKKSYPGTGSTWFDVSNNGKNSTSFDGGISDANFSTDGGGCLDFVPNADIPVPQIASNDITVEIWFKSDANGYRGLYGNGAHFRIWQADSSLKWWCRGDGFGGTVELSVGSVISLGVWTYVAATCESNGLMKSYKNGNFLKSTSFPYVMLDGNNNATIGNTYNGDTGFFDGKIAMVRHYTRALTADEIRQNYDAQKGRFGL